LAAFGLKQAMYKHQNFSEKIAFDLSGCEKSGLWARFLLSGKAG